MTSRIQGAMSVTPRSAASTGPAKFSHKGIALDSLVKEASDVVALPGGAFLVVGDLSDEARLVSANGDVRKVKLPGIKDGKSGLEGVAYDPVRQQLFVSVEEKKKVIRYDLSTAKGEAKKDGTFELDLGKHGNKGIEGMCFLPGASSPTASPQLVVAKEGKPRTLAFVAPNGKGDVLPISLPPALLEVCKDFSALAADPLTGHLFVASDESASVAELAIKKTRSGWVAELVGHQKLTDGQGKKLERLEGLTFDAQGRMYALTENERALHRYDRR